MKQVKLFSQPYTNLAAEINQNQKELSLAGDLISSAGTGLGKKLIQINQIIGSLIMTHLLFFKLKNRSNV